METVAVGASLALGAGVAEPKDARLTLTPAVADAANGGEIGEASVGCGVIGIGSAGRRRDAEAHTCRPSATDVVRRELEVSCEAALVSQDFVSNYEKLVRA